MSLTRSDHCKLFYALFISVVQSKCLFFKQNLTEVSLLDLHNLASDSSPSVNIWPTSISWIFCRWRAHAPVPINENVLSLALVIYIFQLIWFQLYLAADRYNPLLYIPEKEALPEIHCLMTVLQRSGIEMPGIFIWFAEIVIESKPGVHQYLMVICQCYLVYCACYCRTL